MIPIIPDERIDCAVRRSMIELAQVIDLRKQAQQAGDWTVQQVCTLAITQLRRGMRDTPALKYCADLLAVPSIDRFPE